MARYPEPVTWGQARDERWCGPYSSAPIRPATHHKDGDR